MLNYAKGWKASIGGIETIIPFYQTVNKAGDMGEVFNQPLTLEEFKWLYAFFEKYQGSEEASLADFKKAHDLQRRLSPTMRGMGNGLPKLSGITTEK